MAAKEVTPTADGTPRPVDHSGGSGSEVRGQATEDAGQSAWIDFQETERIYLNKQPGWDRIRQLRAEGGLGTGLLLHNIQEKSSETADVMGKKKKKGTSEADDGVKVVEGQGPGGTADSSQSEKDKKEKNKVTPRDQIENKQSPKDKTVGKKDELASQQKDATGSQKDTAESQKDAKGQGHNESGPEVKQGSQEGATAGDEQKEEKPKKERKTKEKKKKEEGQINEEGGSEKDKSGQKTKGEKQDDKKEFPSSNQGVVQQKPKEDAKEGEKDQGKSERSPYDIPLVVPKKQKKEAKKSKEVETKKEDQKQATKKKEKEEKSSPISEEVIQKLIRLGDVIQEVKATMASNAQRMVGFDQLLAQVEDSTEVVEKMVSSCQLVWKIRDFSERLREARSGERCTLYSPPFNSHINGYKMALSICPMGDGKGKDSHISIFLCLLRGTYDGLLSWPYRHPVIFTLLDQNSDPLRRRNISATFTPNPVPENNMFLSRPVSFRNPSLGLPCFVSHEDLESRDFMKEDTIYIKVVVKIDEEVLL